MILAGLDIGTNALRMLIAEIRREKGRLVLNPLCEGRRITRLGEGIVNTGSLSEAAMGRSLAALKFFRGEISGLSVDHVLAVGTSAVRESSNREHFLSRVRREAGIEVEVISGEEEARRTLLGVRHGLSGDERNFVVMDIGGGSTEFIVVTGGQTVSMTTLPVGVVKLTDRHLKSDPLSAGDLEALRAVVESAVGPALAGMGGLGLHRFVGSAGTVTTLAALELGLKVYDAARVQNMRLSRVQVESWFDKLSIMTLRERRELGGLEPGREDLIIPGTALLVSAMRILGKSEVTVSDYGLREGVLIDFAERRLSL